MTGFSCALITGASSGIGSALARLLASKKIPLILHGRNQKNLEKLASTLRGEVELSTIALDLSERCALIALIREKVPDLVINNAGYSLYGEAVDSTVEEQMKIHEVNGRAPLELTLEAAHALLRTKKPGVILNVSSLLGEIPSPGTAIYGASKGFVTLFSESLDYELAPHHIRVLVSCPGQVATPFAARAAKKSTVTRHGPLLTAEYAALQIWKQIERGKTVQSFDWRYRCGVFLMRHILPKKVIKELLREWVRTRQ